MKTQADEIFIEITKTRGSTPRDAGTAMKVTATQTTGTIGGGALEFRAIKTARAILAKSGPETDQTIPLGPNLGQCCGGAVSLRYTYKACDIDPAKTFKFGNLAERSNPVPLWLWGAGHVGRAVAQSCPKGLFDITWIDSGPDRFPADAPRHITLVPTSDMPLLASRAPTQAHHLIFTYSHDIDLALCAALLKHGAASIGLIGSDTKWARFSKRLSAMGLDPSPIICPIGDKELGKIPANIAKGVVTSLLAQTQSKALA